MAAFAHADLGCVGSRERQSRRVPAIDLTTTSSNNARDMAPGTDTSGRRRLP